MRERFVNIAVFAAVALIIMVMLRLFTADSKEPEVILMPPAVSGIGDLSGGDIIERAVVNRDNAVTVISTLERAASYYRRVSQHIFSGAELSVIDYEVWADGGRYLLKEYRQGEPVKHTLVLGSELWIWYGDSNGFMHLEGSPYSEIDPFLGMLTYEDALVLPDEDIIDAGISDIFREPCIFVEYSAGRLGYVSRLYISQSTGLLMASQTYDGDVLLFEMACEFPVLGAQNNDIFTPPG